jgi:hypothetical protein
MLASIPAGWGVEGEGEFQKVIFRSWWPWLFQDCSLLTAFIRANTGETQNMEPKKA